MSAPTRPARAAALLLLLASACNRTPDAVPLVPIESATFAPALGVDLAQSMRMDSGVYYRDVKVGEGAEVRPGQRVSVHYRGTLVDGTEFDANRAGDTPYTFRLGQGEVIRGWDEGVRGMRVGGERQLVIPASMGYGEQGRGAIPGNAILVFTVTVASAE